MSLIDDALKRAQAAGEGEATRPTNRPWIPTPLPDPAIARRRAVLRWLGIVAAVAIGLVAGVWFVRKEFWSRPLPLPAGEGRGEGRPAAAVVPQPTSTPDAAALATPIVVAASRPTRPPRTPAPTTPLDAAADASVPTPAPRAQQPVAAGRTYAGSVTLPNGVRLELGGIVWSETEPRALLNDRIVGVGAFAEGYSVTKIEENRIALEKDGVTIYLSVK